MKSVLSGIRRTTLFILFGIIVTTAQGQGYFQLGFQQARYACPNVNRIVYVYNYTRPWLSQKMAYFGQGHGYSLIYGQLGKKLGWEMSFSLFKEQHDAFGLEPDSREMGYRRIINSNYAMYFGIPVRLWKSRKFEANIQASLLYTFYILQTLYARNPDFSESRSETPVNQLAHTGVSLGLGLRYFPLRWLGFELRPFVAANFSPLKVAGLSESLQSIQANYELKDPYYFLGLQGSVIFAKRKKTF